jgi:HAD superfamily hydrolase (TIGR01509 family)
MQNLKCIIFDCDGILVDSEHLSNRVLYEMTSALGYQFSIDDLCLQFSGRSLQECFTWIETQTSTALPSNFEKEYRQKTFEIFKKELQPVKGIKEFIASLSIPFCVASSGPREKIRLNLQVTGLLDHFENKIFSSYDVNSWKPDPKIFLHAAAAMGFSPADCVVIEDSHAGVIAGVSGGFRVYALANRQNEIKLKSAGATTFFAIDDLPHLLST